MWGHNYLPMPAQADAHQDDSDEIIDIVGLDVDVAPVKPPEPTKPECPISLQPLTGDSIVGAPDGHVYDKATLTDYIEKKGQGPLKKIKSPMIPSILYNVQSLFAVPAFKQMRDYADHKEEECDNAKRKLKKVRKQRNTAMTQLNKLTAELEAEKLKSKALASQVGVYKQTILGIKRKADNALAPSPAQMVDEDESQDRRVRQKI